MLAYPPRSKGPLFQLHSSKAFFESPNQKLSQRLQFRLFAHTSIEDQEHEMCSTIRPGQGAHYFSFVQPTQLWEDQMVSSHQDVIFGHLLTIALRSVGSKSPRVSIPSRDPLFELPAGNAFVDNPNQFVSPKVYFKLLAHTTIKLLSLQTCSTIRSCLRAHCFSVCCQQGIFAKPRPVALTKTLF